MTDAFPGETTEIRAAQRFDEARLDGFLNDTIGARLTTLAQMSGGQSNPTFLVGTTQGEFVLRKQPPGNLLPSAHAVDREYRILKALQGSGLPTPKAIAFCGDREVLGTSFFLMERVRGRVFTDPFLKEIPKDERRIYYLNMAKTLAKLHKTDWRALGLADFGKTENYFERHVARWSGQWEKSRTRENPSLDKLVEWLPRNMPAPEDVSIFHGDYRLANIMYHPTEPEVVGIFDWELSTLGPAMSDLAHNCTCYSMPEGNPISIRGHDLAAEGLPDEEEYLDAYCAAYGQDRRPLRFHRVFALFRLAVLSEGILMRAKAGTASSKHAEEVGARGISVADQGWKIATHEL